jgi:putative spermidine/putrescine transport system substrate-binding protein
MKLKTVLLGAAGAAALTVGSAGAQMVDEIVVVSWGGAYQASQVNAYLIPYAANNPGFRYIMDESSAEAVARMRAMAEANNLTWDLVDVEAADALRLCDEGLAMPIDHDAVLAPAPDGTPASADFGATLVSECFIPQIVFSTTFGYRSDMVPAGVAPPTDACAVFDLATYPGRRALERRPLGNMEWALLCDGVPYDQVYDTLETEEGIARAFAKLDTIKDQVVWWTAGAQTPQLLADGEVFMGSTYNGRLFAAIAEQGVPIGMAWGYQMLDIDGWVVPAGLPEDRLARVMDFLHFATDTQRLADQAQFISYGPARASSAPLVSTHATLGIEMAPHMPTDPANMSGAFVTNYMWWADYRDEMDARFQAWLAR